MTEYSIPDNKLSAEKLNSYGFKLQNGKNVLVRDILDGQLTVTVTLSEGKLTSLVTDPFDGSEYTLHLSENADGAFVSSVRYEIDSLIRDIKLSCSLNAPSDKDQKTLVAEYCLSRYGDSFEYLWENSLDSAAIRRKDNRKWYGVLMKISSEKLGVMPHRDTHVLNLHVNSAELASLVENDGIFPAYHMNKKHWVTVILDGSVDTEKVYSMIDESYRIGEDKRKLRKSTHTTETKG